MAAVLAFTESPLVTWVQTFHEDKDNVDFQEICDGVFLNDIMAQIDHRDIDFEQEIRRVAKDVNARTQNWLVLLRNITSYYQDVLHQLVVMETPNIIAMVKDPTAESSLRSMKQFLLLLLGCAVQCDHKGDYINTIKTLELDVQQAMVAHIQEVTDKCETVLSLDPDPGLGEKELFRIIRTVTQERDKLAQRLPTLAQEKDYYKQELTTKHGGPLTPPVHLEKYHLYKEVGEWRNKCNRLMEDIDDKAKLVSEVQEDLEDMRNQYLKAKAEIVRLSRDAKAVQSYRDELDVLREKVVKLERYEKDVLRYKDKLGELDYYKATVEELRKDNDVLAESRGHLEDQLSASQKKSESAIEELMRLQLKLEESLAEKDQLSGKLQEVVEENSMLEFEKSKINEGLGTNGGIRRFQSISSMDIHQQSAGHSISDELQACMSSQVTRLESDKDELQRELADARERLGDAHQMVKRVQQETEQDIQKKLSVLERKTKRIQSQTSQELNMEHQIKTAEMERKSQESKQRMFQEFSQRTAKLEQEKATLKEREAELKEQVSTNQEMQAEFRNQVSAHQETQRKDREEKVTLQKKNRELMQNKEELKHRIENIQNSSQRRIQELEQEVRLYPGTPSDPGTPCALCADRKANEQCRNSSPRISPKAGILRRHSLDVGDGRETVSFTRSAGTDCDMLMSSSCPGPELVSQSCQTSPCPAWISYSDGMSEGKVHTDENKNTTKVKSKSKFLDILRPKSSTGRQGSPAPNRPASISGTYNESRSNKTPRRQQSVPSTTEHFKRGDSLRATIQGGSNSSGSHQRVPLQPRPVSDYVPFSRNDRLRCTMPEKQSSYSGGHERRHPVITPGSRSSISSVDSFKLHGTSLDMDMCDPSYSDCHNTSQESFNTDRDLGSPTSTDGVVVNGDPKHSSGHRLIGLRVISSETVKTHIRTSGPKASEKWRALVEKIVMLQDKNQQLAIDNSEMRKTLNSIKFSSERIELLEKRNLELEMENRKLHKIVDSLQSTLSGLNAYDKRTYHFYSNV